MKGAQHSMGVLSMTARWECKSTYAASDCGNTSARSTPLCETAYHACCLNGLIAIDDMNQSYGKVAEQSAARVACMGAALQSSALTYAHSKAHSHACQHEQHGDHPQPRPALVAWALVVVLLLCCPTWWRCWLLRKPAGGGKHGAVLHLYGAHISRRAPWPLLLLPSLPACRWRGDRRRLCRSLRPQDWHNLCLP